MEDGWPRLCHTNVLCLECICYILYPKEKSETKMVRGDLKWRDGINKNIYICIGKPPLLQYSLGVTFIISLHSPFIRLH